MAIFASTIRILAPVALILMGLGCKPTVGDPCKRAQDCGLYVIRQCDVSNAPRDPKLQGECIVENCSFGGCPKEAVCVKVYSTELLSVACDPEAEDIEPACDANLMCVDGTCQAEETGETGDPAECPAEAPVGSLNCACRPNDECLPHEVCLPEGLCADEVRARNSCRRQCKKDNDCRNNYECVATGAGGVYLAPNPTDPTRELTDSICVPRS